MLVEKVFLVVLVVGGFSFLATNLAVSFQIRNKIAEVTDFIQKQVSTFIDDLLSGSEIESEVYLVPEPNIVWYHNTPDYVNASITFFSSDPMYMLKVFETLAPETMSGSEVLFSHSGIRKNFLIERCTSGAVLFRRFLELDLHKLPLTVNVSLIRNRK